jgi:hypothetical protein
MFPCVVGIGVLVFSATALFRWHHLPDPPAGVQFSDLVSLMIYVAFWAFMMSVGYAILFFSFRSPIWPAALCFIFVLLPFFLPSEWIVRMFPDAGLLLPVLLGMLCSMFVAIVNVAASMPLESDGNVGTVE